ncbi:flagellin [Sphingomonas pseudosanguinis]|uniref:Flagellin n=1 Tax=Sphingomonas pseudosanguinis TaxID=413712 RepID=A0A7W6A819_9SPHN|nr:flagellin [Sphingomonas pseudosanguinis]MBB3878347.1 flagellin [Sphingomonas pseudosanguinis]
MTVINTNGAALRAMAATQRANTDLAQSMAKLSSGQRINSAKDDAAGLAISSSMTAQIRGMTQGMRNAMDGVSLIQTADGVLTEVSNMLQRVRELAVQAGSGTYSMTDRAALQKEVTALATQVDQTIRSASFNGVALFNANAPVYDADNNLVDASVKLNVQAGPNIADTIPVSIDPVPIAFTRDNVDGYWAWGYQGRLTDPKFRDQSQSHLVTFDDYMARGKIGGTTVTRQDIGRIVYQSDGDQWYDPNGTTYDRDDNYDAYLVRRQFSLVDELNVMNRYRTDHTMSRVDALLSTVASVQGQLGATGNRLESAIATLTSGTTNLSEARSRIADTDYSDESVKLARAQILAQASTAMLAQANQSQKDVLKLLGQ